MKRYNSHYTHAELEDACSIHFKWGMVAGAGALAFLIGLILAIGIFFDI